MCSANGPENWSNRSGRLTPRARQCHLVSLNCVNLFGHPCNFHKRGRSDKYLAYKRKTKLLEKSSVAAVFGAPGRGSSKTDVPSR